MRVRECTWMGRAAPRLLLVCRATMIRRFTYPLAKREKEFRRDERNSILTGCGCRVLGAGVVAVRKDGRRKANGEGWRTTRHGERRERQRKGHVGLRNGLK